MTLWNVPVESIQTSVSSLLDTMDHSVKARDFCPSTVLFRSTLCYKVPCMILPRTKNTQQSDAAQACWAHIPDGRKKLLFNLHGKT